MAFSLLPSVMPPHQEALVPINGRRAFSGLKVRRQINHRDDAAVMVDGADQPGRRPGNSDQLELVDDGVGPVKTQSQRPSAALNGLCRAGA